MTGPRPLRSDADAVRYALAMVGRGSYRLGTGDIDTKADDQRDCFGFAVCEAFGIKRHRPGFNRGWYVAPTAEFPEGRTPSVVDDLNCDAAIEDADHHQELFERVFTPFPGALIMYPTIHLPGHAMPWIGHVKLIVGVSRCLEWDHERPDWALLDTVECCPGHEHGIVRGTGLGMATHDKVWPLPHHRTAMVRVLP